MEYKVVPFVASITQGESTAQVAVQLEKLIAQYSSEGWNYIRLESVSTFIKGENGCFGLGATPDRMTSYQMLVFDRT